MGQLDGAKLITKINSTSKNVKKNPFFSVAGKNRLNFIDLANFVLLAVIPALIFLFSHVKH